MVESINPMAARAQVLEPLFAAQRMLALIEGAETTGVLSALADGATVEQVAEQSGQSLAAVHAIVAALRSGEVVEAHGNGFRLTAPWAALRSEASFFSFPVALAGDRIKAGQLRRVAEGDSYWTSSPDEQIAMAAAVSPDPVAGGFIHIIRQHLADGHPYALAVRDATSVLELGCGLAGAALSQLRVYPDLQVVGVEISEHLAAEAVRRAEMVGVADRFTMVVGDAVDYREDRDFDVGFWSQFFFAMDKREAAMQVLLDHVRSGGTVAAPGRWFDLETDPTGPIAQDYLLFRVLAQASDVPERDPAQLIAELESAGFTDPKVTRGGPSQFMVVVTRP